jgi:hypothetical protein
MEILVSPSVLEPVRLRSAVAQPAPATADAVANRTIENLVITLFWLLVLEGALRKWVAPQYSRYLFFLRDPVMLLVYWQAMRLQALRNMGPLLQTGIAFSFVAILLAFVQSITFGDSRLLPVLAYGWRQYFFYLPLPFIMAATLNEASLIRFARHAFLAVMVNLPIVLLQRVSPASSIINRGIADDVALQFQSFAFTGGGIRPSGTFTTTVGVKELIASSAALLFGVWLTPPARRRMGNLFLIVSAAALAMCLAVSGSRAAFVHVSIVLLAALALGFISRSSTVRARAVLIPLVLVGSGVILYPIVFPDALRDMLQRVSEAQAAEMRFSSLGIFGRALYEYVDFFSLMGQSPIAGYGLGLGGNGRTFISAGAITPLGIPYAESDWSRHIVDLGPLIGVMFIVYRLCWVGWLAARSWRVTRLVDRAFPLLLFGYVGIGLLNGQLTGHGTVGGFLWIFLGLAMTACRMPAARR